MRCRAASAPGPEPCPTCGEERLDLSDAVDLAIVKTALTRSTVGAGLVGVGAGIVGYTVLAFADPGRPTIDPVLPTLAALVLVVLPPLVWARVVERRWGLVRSDLESPPEAAKRRASLLALVTGVPWWAAIACIGVHVARTTSPALDVGAVSYALRFAEVRAHAPSLHLLTYALLHADAAHLAANVVGLLVFGMPLQHRVGRLGALAVLLAGIVASGIAEPLLSDRSDAETLVGISGGVYAWIVAPAVLDPNAPVILSLRGTLLPSRLWVRAFVMVFVWGLISALTHPEIALFGHLGGALAGATVALPLRAIPPGSAYLVWREENARRTEQIR